MAPDSQNRSTRPPFATARSRDGSDHAATERRNDEVMLARRRSVRSQAARIKRTVTQGW